MAILIAIGVESPAQAVDQLIPQGQLQQFGLQRSWFSHVDLNPGANRVERAILSGEDLVVLTTAGVLHFFDAETGATRWITRVGNPSYQSLGPAVTAQHVAIINGSTLYVYDRQTRRELFQTPVGGGPGAGPALSSQYVFVPLFNGRIEGYPLTLVNENQVGIVWYYQSAGRLFTRPVASPTTVAWPNDFGYMYVAGAEATGLRYRFESRTPFVAPATLRSPNVYGVSEEGYLYALDELTGRLRWRYSAGVPATRSPVLIGERIYLATDEPSLHVVDEAGLPVWVAPGVAQILSVTPTHVYGLDRFGALMVLDGKSGALLGVTQPNENMVAVVNDHSDRLYTVSALGLVQCFHEIGADQPVYHTPPAPTAEEAAQPPAPPTEQPATPPPARAPADPGAEEESPFDVEPMPEAEAPEADPFGPDDDPFAF